MTENCSLLTGNRGMAPLRILTGLALLLAGGLICWWLWSRPEFDETAATQPLTSGQQVHVTPEPGYVGSTGCRDCHADQYQSWHASYHRSMTQPVSPETLLAPLDEPVELQTRGRTTRFDREGDQYFVSMVDPDWELNLLDAGIRIPDDPEQQKHTRRPLLLATGSHHVQTFWVGGRRGNQLHQVPWAWHRHEQRWIPLPDIFLLPPDTPPSLHATWNEVCIQCHTVRGQPQLDFETGEFDSRVTELGISCEACHGPGEAHARHYRQQLPATDSDLTTNAADSAFGIVHPGKLDHERSAFICGQCHSDFAIASDSFWKTGHPYRPGQDLLQTRLFPEPQPGMEAYWDDGTARVGGREFTAMAQSGCYQHGEMSCLSCHSMHSSDPNDQLTAAGGTNQACLQCHTELAQQIPQHTHHAAGSSGSECLNCHMPYSSFALMKSIRSHRIDSPTALMTAAFGRPNACNLCHLDKTLDWTGQWLSEWYGQPEFSDDSADAEVSAAVRLLLTGDAAQRAVTAASFGWQPAMDVSGHDWPPAILSFLLRDPYSVVRYIAQKSLRTYAGFDEVEYDFLMSPKSRREAARLVLDLWKQQTESATANPATLIGPDNQLQRQRLEELLLQRDDRPVALPE